MLRRVFNLVWVRFALFHASSAWESVRGFLGGWWVTRPWFSLLGGLPAISCALAFLAISPWYARRSTSDWVLRYERAGSVALQRGDWETAEVYFRRVSFLGGESPLALYGLALTAEQQGDLSVARRRMQQIAPESQPGYPPAHYWLAMDLMRREAPWSRQDLGVLEHHLLQSLRQPANEAEARASLAWVYEVRGEIDKAIEEVERLAPEQPGVHLALAQLYALAGRTDPARRSAIRASEFLAARTLAEPDQPMLRISWAASLGLQGRFEDAVNVLKPGLSWPDPAPFHQALASAYLHWFSTTTTRDNVYTPQQMALLERVLHHDPTNQQAVVILCNYLTGPSDSAARAADLLNGMLEHGTVPAVVHLALGIRWLHQGEPESATAHLRQAVEDNPHLPALLNNLAWDMAHRDSPDLELACGFAQAAVQLDQHPEFHDTLGTILAKLERWDEALIHLETARRQLPPRAELHQKLGDVYRKLGKTDLAAEHQRQAAELQSPVVQGESS